jgi:hypothetical protein
LISEINELLLQDMRQLPMVQPQKVQQQSIPAIVKQSIPRASHTTADDPAAMNTNTAASNFSSNNTTAAGN